MKIVRSSDWREELPFETPMIAAAVAPGAASRCAACPGAQLYEREQLWAVKHKHPNNPAGFVRLYCAAHVPVPQRAPEPSRPSTRSRRTPRASSAPARRPDRPEPKPAAVCPDCFVEVSANGVCGMCGNRLA